jgi:hypothetical protein
MVRGNDALDMMIDDLERANEREKTALQEELSEFERTKTADVRMK